MGQTGFFHHIGSFFLFAAVVLLIITDISAPVVSNISLLRVELNSDSNNSGRQPVITFGTFGWCTQDVMASGEDFCSRAAIGYDPTSVLEEYLSTSSSSDSGISDAASATATALTRVMVLHPVATGVAFISFLLAAGAGFIGSLLGSLGALLSFLIVLVALICDFVGLAIVRNAINGDDGALAAAGASASWGSAAWTVLVAAICCLLASVILFFTCCSSRVHRRREVKY